MSETYQRPNTPALTKIVDTALDGSYGAFEAMREGLHRALGMPSLAEEVAGQSPTQQTVSAMPEAASGEPRDIRVLYLHGNSRFEIEGTQAQLDAQETALRALYQR